MTWPHDGLPRFKLSTMVGGGVIPADRRSYALGCAEVAVLDRAYCHRVVAIFGLYTNRKHRAHVREVGASLERVTAVARTYAERLEAELAPSLPADASRAPAAARARLPRISGKVAAVNGLTTPNGSSRRGAA